MRTNIVSQALNLCGFKTKREAVEAGLAILVKMAKEGEIRAVRGKLHWEGNLDAMRRDA